MTIPELRSLLAKASPGPWEVDTEHDGAAEYSRGPDPDRGYDNFIVFDAKGLRVLDTLNSDAKCIEEEPHSDEDGYRSAWDGVGKANTALIVSVINALPELLTALEASSRQEERLSQVAMMVPDEIDLFRIIRAAGRSNVSKMKAVDAALQPLRAALEPPHAKDAADV